MSSGSPQIVPAARENQDGTGKGQRDKEMEVAGSMGSFSAHREKVVVLNVHLEEGCSSAYSFDQLLQCNSVIYYKR